MGYYKIRDYQYIDSTNSNVTVQVIDYYDDEEKLLTSETFYGEIRQEHDRELPE